MAFYTIAPERRTLHGHFSRDLPPVLEIDSGDTVRFTTLEAGWGIGPRPVDGGEKPMFTPRDSELDRGHALCGPVAIRGAEPGMALQIDIGQIRPGAWGWTVAGGWKHPINERFGYVEGDGFELHWTIDADAGIARDHRGHAVTVRPFMGVMGMPPAEEGRHPTSPPRPTGGNLDCKELVAGTTLYLPIAVPGGLFSTGDGHGAQGDGEASVTAIECPIERVDLTFTLRDDMPIATPHARTAEGWLTFGLDESLDEAMLIALDAMLDLLAERFAVDRQEALALASVAVDLRITQVANGVQGVHAVLPHGAIR